MKRRDFIRMTATATGTLFCGGVELSMAQQAAGPYWLLIDAKGGWDPTSFCDPKGSGLGPNGDINNYDRNDIGQAGNIRYAPPPDSFANDTTLFRNSDFFNAHFQRLLVINGINFGTNSHSVGKSAGWSGKRTDNYPSIGPLIAAALAPQLPLPFVAGESSTSSRTSGVVPRVVVGGSDLPPIKEFVHPNRINVDQAAGYHSDPMRALIDAAATARRQQQIADQRLTRIRNAMILHDQARTRDVSPLKDFVAALESPSAPNAYVGSRSAARSIFDQAQTAFAAFESGTALTAQVRLSSFDTHSNHDALGYPRMMDYLGAVDNIIADATARGIADNLIIIMGSDFGRTNKYNNDAGKDHWPHGSYMIWAGPQHMTGNRVVGATDDLQISRRINPTTLALDDNGVELTTEYVHQALRNLAGIDQHPFVTGNFPLSEQVLPIFS